MNVFINPFVVPNTGRQSICGLSPQRPAHQTQLQTNQIRIIMNPLTPSKNMPIDGEERLTDAMLHEHARLGSQADAPFLQQLDHRLLGGSLAPILQRTSRHVIIGSLAAAAAVVLVAGLIWKNRDSMFAGLNHGATTGGMNVATNLPPEQLDGTPVPMKVPGLAAIPTTAPTLMVPQGTELLSKGKPVTSSDNEPIIGSLDLVTDGDKDAGEGYYVELLDGLQWVQIDLEQSADLEAIWVWHFHSQLRAYHDVIIQISDDPEFKQGVTTVFNNDYDDSARMGKGKDSPYPDTRYGLLVNAKGTPGRYVRLYSKGNTANEMNHLIEVEVFGLRK